MTVSPADRPVRVTPRAVLLRADNAGPMTLDGTNTWLLAEPGAAHCVVVDPGPDDPAHLRAVADTASDAGQSIAVIALTHSHVDHAAGAPALARLTGARVLARDPGVGAALDRELDIDGLHVMVIDTPGHSADSVSLHIPADHAVLTGDHVLGRGTTLIEHPGGRLADYLDSLERVLDVEPLVLLPGHGPVLDDPAGTIRDYTRHRAERLAQLTAAIACGAATSAELVRAVYPDVAPALRPMAELNVLASLAYLVERGALSRNGGRYEPG